ncbi:MAG: cadherin domain-containing protein [Verrucomicrobia bacterium]|nr:cadherin domain-containing protein [Verrucomicrobiota bacterium]
MDCIKPDGLWNVLINNGDPVDLRGTEESFPETSVDLWASDVGKGIDSISLTYRAQTGTSSLSAFLSSRDLVEGTHNSGRFSGTTSINRCIAEGIYCLSRVWIRDKAGNTCSFDNEVELNKWLETTDGSIQTKVEIINDRSDILAPIVASPLLFEPATADITSQPVVLNVTVELQDEGCGISFPSISLIHCDDPSAQSLFGFLSLDSGDANSGIWKGQISVPFGTTIGQYAPRLEITDRVQNRAIYGAAFSGSFFFEERLLFPEGSTLKVAVTSQIPKIEDLTPPVLVNGSVDCSFDFVEANGYVTLTFQASDPESGMDLGFGSSFGFGRFPNSVELLSPKGMADQIVPVTIENLDFESLDPDFNPIFRVMVPLPKGVSPGEYCWRIRLTNKCGLSSTFGFGPEEIPFPVEFPGSCTILNSGPADCTPPIPVELTVTPGKLLVGNAATLNVCLRITDVGTGLQFANLELLNGLPGDFGSRQSIFSDDLDDPAVDERATQGSTINDVTYKFEIPLDGDEFGGDFLSFRLSLTDCAQNFRTYDSSICNFNYTAYPLPFHIVQIGTAGNEDPAITSDGGGETASIETTQNQTGVTTVTASDTDFPADKLVFSIEGGADDSLFDIDPNTGVLTFKSVPVFGADNSYEVIVQVSDQNGGLDTQTITVNVLELDVNDPPVIVSNGGGDTATIIVEEGTVVLTTLMATDQDSGDTMTFSITGGADADLFNLNSTSKVLSFKSAQAFASPADANGDNDYEVTIGVVDNGDPVLMDSQAITVRVIKIVVDENEYEAYANEAGGPFPSNASAQQKAIDFDFDGDGQTNGEEFAAGTNPNDADDYFRSMVGYDPVQGFKIVFFPYFPDLNEYTLMSAFEGPNNDESTSLNISAQPFDGDPMMGCFVVPPSTGSLENLILFINTLKVSL